MDAFVPHVSVVGLYASTVERCDDPFHPPTAYRMPSTVATPRPYRAVGIGAFVVQEPLPGTTAKSGREGATLFPEVGSRSQLIAHNVTGRNRVARQPSGIAPTRRDSAARCF